MTTITFEVAGTPVTQGSTKAFVRGGRAIITHDKRGPLLNWRNDIAYAARDAAKGEYADRGVPVYVAAAFSLQRPKSAPKRVVLPTTKPDIDKLLRALLDACTGVLWADDSQVVDVRVIKNYAGMGTPPGCHVEIRFEPIQEETT